MTGSIDYESSAKAYAEYGEGCAEDADAAAYAIAAGLFAIAAAITEHTKTWAQYQE
jgi:hypothetical protein